MMGVSATGKWGADKVGKGDGGRKSANREIGDSEGHKAAAGGGGCEGGREEKMDSRVRGNDGGVGGSESNRARILSVG
ncbi:MAG: hypothetical protein D8M59_15490 [Planctomycetes bacterium]|nr:hypothetical protein [Planctomycetota bacterium]